MYTWYNVMRMALDLTGHPPRLTTPCNHEKGILSVPMEQVLMIPGQCSSEPWGYPTQGPSETLSIQEGPAELEVLSWVGSQFRKRTIGKNSGNRSKMWASIVNNVLILVHSSWHMYHTYLRHEWRVWSVRNLSTIFAGHQHETKTGCQETCRARSSCVGWLMDDTAGKLLESY